MATGPRVWDLLSRRDENNLVLGIRVHCVYVLACCSNPWKLRCTCTSRRCGGARMPAGNGAQDVN